MSCPSCGNSNYYFGLQGHSCNQKNCVHFDKYASNIIEPPDRSVDWWKGVGTVPFRRDSRINVWFLSFHKDKSGWITTLIIIPSITPDHKSGYDWEISCFHEPTFTEFKPKPHIEEAVDRFRKNDKNLCTTKEIFELINTIYDADNCDAIWHLDGKDKSKTVKITL